MIRWRAVPAPFRCSYVTYDVAGYSVDDTLKMHLFMLSKRGETGTSRVEGAEVELPLGG